MIFKCKNCENDCNLPNEFAGGAGLTESSFEEVDVKCKKCGSVHSLSLKYSRGHNHNILAYLIDFQFTEKIKASNAFWFEETNNPFTLSGYISNYYLILGFDNDRELKKKIDSVKNITDKEILKSCFKLIKLTRNKITQHNKEKSDLSTLTENEIYPLFLNCINTMVILLKRNGHMPYDLEDRRIKSREITFL